METSPDLRRKIMIITICLIPIFLQELFSKENCIRKVLEEETQELTASKSQTGVNQLTFVTYKYIDPMVGMEAFRLLIPKGWQVDGSITWSANPALPSQSRFRFFNPFGAEQLELFPTQSYFWTDNQVFLSTNPPGTFRFGTLVAQPMDLQSAFNDFIIPSFRSNLSGLQ